MPRVKDEVQRAWIGDPPDGFGHACDGQPGALRGRPENPVVEKTGGPIGIRL